MALHVPPDDTERVPLSGAFTQPWALALAWAPAGGMVLVGTRILRAGGPEAPLGAVLIALPLLGVLVWWRWGTPLRRVVATRTGLLVSRLGGEWFIPYSAVESARESRIKRTRIITVTLRAPVGGTRRFAFVPPYRRVGINDDHPIAAELARRLDQSQKA